MKILNYPTLLVCFFFSCASLVSSSRAFAYDATLSVGNLCEYIGKIQTDDKGSTNVCEFNPYLAGGVDFALSNQFILSPEVSLSIPKSGRDTNISKMNIVLLANSKYKVSSVHFILGAGLFFTRISGSGGTETLNNGNGSVSYPIPDGIMYTRNFIVNLGLGLDFNKDWSADLHTYIFNLTKKEDRAISLAFNGTYHFGEF